MEIDFSDYFPSSEREFATIEHLGKPARRLAIRRNYPTTAENLWHAITNKERISGWFTVVDGNLELGGRFALEGNAEGEIIECTPEQSYKITWEYAGDISWVNVYIEPAPDGVNFLLEHIAYIPQEWMDQYGPGAAGVGWDLGLLGLGHHLTTGELHTPAESEEWALSDSGKTFINESSSLWCVASIADGTPPESARKAAANTTAFYTDTEPPQN